MEKIQKEMDLMGKYITAMKKNDDSGDCDNLLMHLNNIQELVKIITYKPVLSVVYLIRYGAYIDNGFIEKIASSEKAIKQIVKDDERVMRGKGVIDVNVDFDKCEINYTYTDWDDEIEEGKLYFDKVEVV